MEPDKELIEAEIERLEAVALVIDMQEQFNAELKKHYGARISWGAIRSKVPDFCHGVLGHEKFQRYKELTLADVLFTWGLVCNMKPKELEKLAKLTSEKISDMKEKLSE